MQKVVRRAPLPGLTALRFFAASYVLLFHFYPRQPAGAAHPEVVYRVIEAGFSGVSCFFILSGFILAYTHESVTDLRGFLRARFARVYPLYLFAFVCALPLFFQEALRPGQHGQFWAIPAALLLLQDWFPSLAFSVNPPAWTLSCEAFFYLLFPFAVRWLARQRRHFWLLLAGFWAFQLLPAVLNNAGIGPQHPAWSPSASDWLIMPIARVGEFLAGVVLGLRFLDQKTAPTNARAATSWLLPLSVGVCLVALSFNLILPHEVIRNGLMLGPYCLLIWAFAGSTSRLLASRWLQIGGEISYGVYLLQIPYVHVLFHLDRWFPSAFRSGFWILTVYPAAWLTYTLIEKPCRSFLLHRKPSSADKPIPTPQPELP